MYNVIDLSKYIVSKCFRDGYPIPNMLLQKMLYYIQKDFVRNGKTAFDSVIEAWTFGPVIPEAFYHFCGFGTMPITTDYEKDIKISIDEEDKKNIDIIIERLKTNKPHKMVEDSDNPDKVWSKVYNNGKGLKQPIPTYLLKEESCEIE